MLHRKTFVKLPRSQEKDRWPSSSSTFYGSLTPLPAPQAEYRRAREHAPGSSWWPGGLPITLGGFSTVSWAAWLQTNAQ